jgi:hypothetical protein
MNLKDGQLRAAAQIDQDLGRGAWREQPAAATARAAVDVAGRVMRLAARRA